ncbi:hypothetical protein MPSEU_000838800 [Mayamaea pseudoterrestris]|nr:hypothetical protein MPSEU_000838800 [Mayamaea pseudoterrestris]
MKNVWHENKSLLLLFLTIPLAASWLSRQSALPTSTNLDIRQGQYSLDKCTSTTSSCRNSQRSRKQSWSICRAADKSDEPVTSTPFSHADLVWKIRLPPEATFADRAKWMFQTKKEIANYSITSQPLPRVWLPSEVNQICLEAWYTGRKIARFGITTIPGPSAPPIVETVKDCFGDDSANETEQVRCCAIIYMFVEPEFRSRNVGPLALQVISYIHAMRGANYTLLVADDKGSGKLVHWYQRQAYFLAPELQDLMGSPNQVYGITMIGRALQDDLTSDCTIEWW